MNPQRVARAHRFLQTQLRAIVRFPRAVGLALAVAAAVPGRGDIVQRWSFNDSPLAAVPPGTTLADSIAGAIATVRSGTNGGTTLQASFTGTALTLPGNTTGSQ